MTCRTLTVVHGKSELIFCRGIASNLKISIECDSENGGKTSIQIPHLTERLSTGSFESETSLHKKFGDLEYLKGKHIKMPNLKIFPIMDTGENPMYERSYKTGNMFRTSVFWNNIIPIFNTPNLDEVLISCGFKIDAREKIRSYHALVNEYELSDFIDGLKNCENTNLPVFLGHCASIAPNYQT